MRPWLPLALTGLAAAPVAAADLVVTVELPAVKVAEYHRPYVAIWIERQDQSVAANLAIWYSLKGENNRGATWLKDLRQWWRRSGRDLALPIDGVTGATRPSGSHDLTFRSTHGALASLPPGSYQLVVEAAREVGGREVLKVPFAWPPGGHPDARARGKSEIGGVAVSVRP